MLYLDKLTVGDEKSPLYQSYEYSKSSKLLGLPTWAALLLFAAVPILVFLSFYLVYGKNNPSSR